MTSRIRIISRIVLIAMLHSEFPDTSSYRGKCASDIARNPRPDLSLQWDDPASWYSALKSRSVLWQSPAALLDHPTIAATTLLGASRT
jgi:hypothetical protein